MQHPPYNNSQSGQFQPPPYPQYSNSQYYHPQPQPPRIPGRNPNQSGFKALMLRRIPVPLWVIIVSIFIVLGLLSDVVAFASTHSISDTINSLDGQTPTPVTSIQTPTPTVVPTPTLTPTPTIKPTPTHTPKWTTTLTFKGNGSKKTTVFTVPDSWKLVWSCDPSSSYGGEYNVMVDVKGSDGSDIDPVAVNTICKAGNTSDSTQEYQGGDVYLDVNSEAAWTIQVQVLK